MRACILVLWIFLMFPAASPAQGRKPTTIAELVTYSAKDREQVLYNGAKTEGKVTWYTSLAGESYKGMVKAFETKYAGVKVEAYRVSGSDMTTRMYEESKAKRYIADTVSIAPISLAAICFLPGRRQGKKRTGSLLLGDRPRVLHRLCLQQETAL